MITRDFFAVLSTNAFPGDKPVSKRQGQPGNNFTKFVLFAATCSS